MFKKKKMISIANFLLAKNTIAYLFIYFPPREIFVNTTF